MVAPETPSINSDYAQEWIAFLRRRNTLLSIIWPILLVFALTGGFLAIFYYQSTQAVQLQLDNLTVKQQAVEANNNALLAERQELTEKNTQLIGEIEVLKTAREALSVQQDDSASKLNITSQMLENMEQQLAILKAENAELSDQLVLAREALSEQENHYKAELNKLVSQKSDTLNDLTKQLESRKTAYQALANRQQEMRDEMDRMSNLLTAKEKEVAKVQTEKKALLGELNEQQKRLQLREREIATLQQNYSDLDSKLKALVSPIGVTGSKTGTATEKTGKATDNVLSPSTVTGFEEIKKPKPAPVTNNENPLDYDQIKVLP